VRLYAGEHQWFNHGGELRGSTRGTRSAGNDRLDMPRHRRDQKFGLGLGCTTCVRVQGSAQRGTSRQHSLVRRRCLPLTRASVRVCACMGWTGRAGDLSSGACVRVHGRGCAAPVAKRSAVEPTTAARPAPRQNAPQRHRQGKRSKRQAKGAACVEEGRGTCKDGRHGSMASTQMMSGRAWATRLAHKARFSPQLEGRDPQHGEGSRCSPCFPWTWLRNGGEEVR
jgi:hypothetical protein